MNVEPQEHLAVLLVENDRAAARRVEEMLKDLRPMPVRLIHASRLKEALTHIRAHRFNTILLDLNLPDSEGLATLVRVRAETLEMPVVVLTELANETLALEAMRQGAKDYVVKGPLLYKSIRDAIARQGWEEALGRIESRYRSLVEGSIQGILIHVGGIVRLANRALGELLGVDPEEDLIGAEIWPFIAPEDRPMVAEYAGARLEGRPAPPQYEFRAVRRDGRIIWLDCIVTTIGWEGERAILATVVDVTARKEAGQRLRESEERLLQAQKMEALGRLAGGIAHDFNNLLVAILGYSELVLQDLGSSHPSAHDLRQLHAAAKRGASLTYQLLAFSRRQILQPQVIDLNQALERVESLLRRVIGEHITLNLKLTTSLARVSVDPGQIEQVILNLALNARDAMAEGGHLTIETATVELDEAYTSRRPTVPQGTYIMLAVSDTGTGMDEETQRRLFEPFFTTKELGKGTGLGLATVYGIVKQSRGWIWVYSEPGLGSTFKVYLPAVNAELSTEETQRPGETQPTLLNGIETVLVAEDQDEPRSVICETLFRHGYTVLEAKNGPQAIMTARIHQGVVHLLLTDVVMPGMSGRRLAEILHSSHPDLRVIYMTGYTDNAIVHHGILDSALVVLQKPFTGETLLRKIREVLDAR